MRLRNLYVFVYICITWENNFLLFAHFEKCGMIHGCKVVTEGTALSTLRVNNPLHFELSEHFGSMLTSQMSIKMDAYAGVFPRSQFLYINIVNLEMSSGNINNQLHNHALKWVLKSTLN